MNDAATPAATPAAAQTQEQPATGATATASFFLTHKPDVIQPKYSEPNAPVAEAAAQVAPVATEAGAVAETTDSQPEKPYNAMETMRAVQTHVPHVDANELRLAEGLISRGYEAAQKTPLTPQQIAEGNTACMEHLNSTHGPAKAERLIADARAELQAMAQHMPGLPHILEVSGYGNFPWLIERLAANYTKRQFRK